MAAELAADETFEAGAATLEGEIVGKEVCEEWTLRETEYSLELGRVGVANVGIFKVGRERERVVVIWGTASRPGSMNGAGAALTADRTASPRRAELL